MKFALFAPFLLVLASSLVGCGSTPITIKTDIVTSEFDQFSTFSWYPQTETLSPEAKAIDAVVKSLVNEQLVAKKYAQVQESDFLVNYKLTSEDRFDVKAMNVYSGYGDGFVWRHGQGGFTNEVYVQSKEYDVQEFKKGTLVIDIINTKTNKLAWRGVANKRIEQKLNNVEVQAALKEAIGKLLKGIPNSAR